MPTGAEAADAPAWSRTCRAGPDRSSGPTACASEHAEHVRGRCFSASFAPSSPAERATAGLWPRVLTGRPRRKQGGSSRSDSMIDPSLSLHQAMTSPSLRTKTRPGKPRLRAICERLEDRRVPTLTLGGLGALLGGGLGIGIPGSGIGGTGSTTDSSTTLDPANTNDGGTLQGPDNSLSTSLNVTSTTPADGSTLTSTPTSVSVSFDRAIDPWYLFSDFEVRQVGPSGETLSTDSGHVRECEFERPHAN